MKNVPANSHMSNDVFLPMTALGNPRWLEDWTWPGMLTYVKLTAGADAADRRKKNGAFLRRLLQQQSQGARETFQPLSAAAGCRLFAFQMIWSIAFGRSGNYTNLLIFSAVGLFILLIACINFINLATARATTRAKEVGIRKVAGAKRSELIGQFMLDAWLTTCLALLLALGLVICRPAAVQPSDRL